MPNLSSAATLLPEIARPVDAPCPDTWPDAETVPMAAALGNKVLNSFETDMRALDTRTSISNTGEKEKGIISHS